MLSRDTRFVLFVVFGFLLVTSEFSGFGRIRNALQGGGSELASGESSSIFVDAQWGGGYGGGYGRR